LSDPHDSSINQKEGAFDFFLFVSGFGIEVVLVCVLAHAMRQIEKFQKAGGWRHTIKGHGSPLAHLV